MGMFNKWEFNAKEEAARRAENLRIFHEMNKDIAAKPFIEADFAELEIKAVAQTPVVKIEKDMGFCSATCPNCGKVKILDKELKTMTAVCNKCYCAFLLEEEIKIWVCTDWSQECCPVLRACELKQLEEPKECVYNSKYDEVWELKS